MITRIRVRNRQLVRDEQDLMLFHGPKAPVPEGTPTSAAGIWGGQGTGKSSLVDQIDWLSSVIRLNGAEWRRWIPVLPNHDPGTDNEEITSCVINTLDETGEYEYTLAATREKITTERLWHRPGKPGENQPIGIVVLDRNKNGVMTSDGVRRARTKAKREETRKPVLAKPSADENPMMRTVRKEIRGITIVRPTDDLEIYLELTALAAEVEEPGDSPAGLRRRLVQGLLENLGVKLENLDDGPSKTVREKLGKAGGSARCAAVIAVQAAHVLTHGGLLVVDPIDAGVHSAWNRQLVETFTGQPETSLRRGQLLFTTGSVDLLTALAPDQVWLTDLATRNRAQLDSLATFKNVRPATVRQAYEVGRFGGVPGDTPTALQAARNDTYKHQLKKAGQAAGDGDKNASTERRSG